MSTSLAAALQEVVRSQQEHIKLLESTLAEVLDNYKRLEEKLERLERVIG